LTLPANIRVNTLLPFPSLVMGAGPVSVTKNNGIWTINLSATALAQESPTGSQLNNDLMLVFDPIVGNWFTVPMSFFAVGGGGSTGQKQRSVTAGPVIISATDQILNLNIGSILTITLPGYASRNGVPLTFKDVGQQASGFPLVISAAAAETIDGFATIPFDTNGMEVTLLPFNDGVNSGWSVLG